MNGIKFKSIESIKDIKITFKKPGKKKLDDYRDFNFFYPYIGKEKKNKDKNLYIIIASSVILTGIIISSTWNYVHINNTKKEIEQMKKVINLPESRAKLAQSEKLSKKEDILKKYYYHVQIISAAINKKELISSNLMRKVSSAIPQSVSFKTISVNEDNVQIQGIAGSRVNIAEFQHNLKDVDVIKDVQVMTINENSNSNAVNTAENKTYTFTLKCTLKDVDENEN